MGATPPEMNGLYGTSPLYGGSGGSSGKRGGYLSSSPRGGAAHPSECVWGTALAAALLCSGVTPQHTGSRTQAGRAMQYSLLWTWS